MEEESTKTNDNDAAFAPVTSPPPFPQLDGAGPSTALPGAVTAMKSHLKMGLSKSEHCIRHIITAKDVAEALNLTSIGYCNAKIQLTNLALKDIKLPGAVCVTREKADDAPAVVAVETTFLAKPIPVAVDIPAVPAVLTESNEVEPKSAATEKTSNLSERTDIGVRDSLNSIGSNVCRICMTRGMERLISPCNCKGSLANVHLTCLERWLNQVGRNHCELCGFSYPAIRTPRYTIIQALRLWFGNPRNWNHLQSDCLIFWLLSTVTAGLLAVCIVGTQYFVIEGSKYGKQHSAHRKDEGISHRITKTAMDFFMGIVLCGYCATVYLLLKDHYLMWNRWRRSNVNVRLMLSPDSSPVPFVPRPRYNDV